MVEVLIRLADSVVKSDRLASVVWQSHSAAYLHLQPDWTDSIGGTLVKPGLVDVNASAQVQK